MLCVTFLHLYVFLLRRTLPRNGQGFPEPQNRLTFSTSIVQTATAKLLFAPLSREHSIKLWFKANIKGGGEPLVPLYGCWNPNVCLDSTKDKIRDRAGAVFHSRHYSHGASHNRGLVLQFVNDGGPTFCPRCLDEKHNAINLLLSNLICFCCAVELSNPRTRLGNSMYSVWFSASHHDPILLHLNTCSIGLPKEIFLSLLFLCVSTQDLTFAFDHKAITPLPKSEAIRPR